MKDNSERDARETSLVMRAKKRDPEAVRELLSIAEPVIRMAVRKNLNGCCNHDAESDAASACREELIRSVDEFDPDRGVSIRTLWYYGFRRAVVAYVRTKAKATTHEVLVGLDSEVSETNDDRPEAPDEVLAVAEEVAARNRRLAAVECQLTELQKTDPVGVQAFRLWVRLGSYADVGRAMQCRPSTTAARVRRITLQLQERLPRYSGRENDPRVGPRN